MSRKIVSLVLAVIMLVAVCATSVFAAYNASGFSQKLANTYETAAGVTFKEYDATSGKVNSNTGKPATTVYDANLLIFGTADYQPMVYSSWAGGAEKLEAQYNKAVQEGYEVVGVINGSFFSMNDPYGTLTGINISDGKVTSAHAGWSGSSVVFGSDGSMKIVESALQYKLYIDGTLVPDGLGHINKRGGGKTWYNTFYYYDQSCGPIDKAKTDTVEANPGYEILCDKLDGTEMTVGGTLKGKVVEIRKDSYHSSLGRNQFVLFCKNGSPFASYLTDLQVGDPIEISVDETVEASKETMRNASSVIPNVGWLVKDGVDQTEIVDEISHSVEYAACWTAFGTKPNGEYVFFVSEGASQSGANPTSALTMKDVAKIMIAEGCNNVIRMDGGGSSAMYLENTGSGSKGYVFNQGRSVGDCIMIVKRSSMQSDAKKTALQNAVTSAEQLLTTTENIALQNAVGVAKAVLNNTASLNSDYIHALAGLLAVKDGMEDLKDLIAQYESVDRREYSRYALGVLDTAATEGNAVLSNKNATAADYNKAVGALRLALDLKGTVVEDAALGKKYTYSKAPSGDYPDTNNCELTDGELGSTSNPAHPSWVGVAADFDIVLDLGEKRTDIRAFSLNFIAMGSWAIGTPESVKISISDDGKNYNEVGTIGRAEQYNAEGAVVDYRLDGINASGRYVKFDIKRTLGFVFVSEITAEIEHEAVGVLRGDINQDAEVNAFDYLLVKRHAVGAINLNDEQAAAADFNGDGKVDAFDYLLLKRIVLGIVK